MKSKIMEKIIMPKRELNKEEIELLYKGLPKKPKTPQLVKIDWQKVFYFSFITSTSKHKKRRVIPLNKLRKCLEKQK